VLLVDTSVWIEVFKTVLHDDRDFSLLAQVSSLQERKLSKKLPNLEG
jgi:hypothetical protein